MHDDLGDRMKAYEGAEAQRRLMPRLPVLARLDGRSFSGFTRDMGRPFDARLSGLMADVTKQLVAETDAAVGFTQSDEISLAWYTADPKAEPLFGSRVQKLCSVLAATCSVRFAAGFPGAFADAPDRVAAVHARAPVFDCRVWTVPTLDEAANAFLWRELDATKNAVSMAARAYFSHARLQDLNGKQMQELLFQEKGVNFNDYPAFFKRGTYVRRAKVTRRLTAAELADLPEKHHARANPDLEFERSVLQVLDLPPLTRVANRVAVLFHGADPAV